MTNKTILVLAIVGTFAAGIFLSGDIAIAAKPLTEVLVANPDPISVTVDNFPDSSSEVIVANTEPIPVSGIASSPVCPPENVQHWYTVQMRQELSNVELRSPTNPTLFEGVDYWINIHSDSVYIMEYQKSVIDRLNELGYEAFDLNIQTSVPLTYNAIAWFTFPPFDLGSHTTICAGQ